MLGHLVGGYGHHKHRCGREIAVKGVCVGLEVLAGIQDFQRKSRQTDAEAEN